MTDSAQSVETWSPEELQAFEYEQLFDDQQLREWGVMGEYTISDRIGKKINNHLGAIAMDMDMYNDAFNNLLVSLADDHPCCQGVWDIGGLGPLHKVNREKAQGRARVVATRSIGVKLKAMFEEGIPSHLAGFLVFQYADWDLIARSIVSHDIMLRLGDLSVQTLFDAINSQLEDSIEDELTFTLVINDSEWMPWELGHSGAGDGTHDSTVTVKKGYDIFETARRMIRLLCPNVEILRADLEANDYHGNR